MPDTRLLTFNELVGVKFQLYNSLFTSLPFHRIEKTGLLVSILLMNCEEGYAKKNSPVEIIDAFFDRQTALTTTAEKADLLFRIVQYVERQVVLFDALEDAAFAQVNDMTGKGTLKQLLLQAAQQHLESELREQLQSFSVNVVLTAHPTQFYRGVVLGIIHDLAQAIQLNSEGKIYSYLQQLGRTPFFKQEKPTPYDEAVSLIWYLENVFYAAAGRIISFLQNNIPGISEPSQVLQLGFWPGGDRDGNPFVNATTTLQVANALRGSIIRSYYMEVRKLKRRLTFKGVDQALARLEKQLYEHLFLPDHPLSLRKEDILLALQDIRRQLLEDHSGLFAELVESLIHKVNAFGLYFASLDVRQESSVHGRTLEALAEKGALPAAYLNADAKRRMELLAAANAMKETVQLEDELLRDTVNSMRVIRKIQEANGERGCHRYIISQCNSALNVMEVYGLLLLAGWDKNSLWVDIVPLFETVKDLQGAGAIMDALYRDSTYRQHLQQRANRQTIMVGFSDGTKDGGYLMANWSIYKAKEELTALSAKYGVEVVFFDGRGGPPARGGGKTHQFYASMGKNISGREIQLTIQGQTVSYNFGTVDAAQYNIEQLMHAGLSNRMLQEDDTVLHEEEEELLTRLSAISYEAYQALRDDPCFLEYLGHASPLRFYAETNIGSRPAKRGAASKLALKDLRAIPFVGAWSQLKQNVTGYYGVGTALRQAEVDGRWEEVRTMYRHSLFFRTLMDNCEMAMEKCFFPLTAFLAEHPVYGQLWKKIEAEYELTREYVLKLSGNGELMEGNPVDRLSIRMRERIVLPLATIQQYAITRVREMEEKGETGPEKNAFEKLVMRCSFGLINASRNSA